MLKKIKSFIEATTPEPSGVVIGDVVKLNSGGPAMCVRETTWDRGWIVSCDWFDKTGEVRKGEWRAGQLTVYSD